jgi:uncharacterized protein YciI
MFIVLLRYSENKSKAAELMDRHNAWIGRGFDDGVFLLVGSLKPNQGGGILAHGVPRAELERRINEDPFVVEDVVKTEILELSPSRASGQLSILLS